MTKHEEFIWWLKGFAELSPTPPTQEQWNSIVEHMNLLFNKVTSPAPGDIPLKDSKKVLTQEEIRKWFEQNKFPQIQPPYYDPNRPYIVPYCMPTVTPSPILPPGADKITLTC